MYSVCEGKKFTSTVKFESFSRIELIGEKAGEERTREEEEEEYFYAKKILCRTSRKRQVILKKSCSSCLETFVLSDETKFITTLLDV